MGYHALARRALPPPFRPVEVILDEDASQHLAVGDADTFEVWFRLAPLSSPAEAKDAAANQPVAVFQGEYQIGALGPDASAAWRPLLREGREVVTFATRKQSVNGEWQLLVGLPYAHGRQPGNSDA